MVACICAAWRVNREHIEVDRCAVVEAVATMGGVYVCIEQHGYVRCMYVLMHTCVRCPQDGVVIGASTRSRGPCYQAYASKLGGCMREWMHFSRVNLNRTRYMYIVRHESILSALDCDFQYIDYTSSL